MDEMRLQARFGPHCGRNHRLGWKCILDIVSTIVSPSTKAILVSIDQMLRVIIEMCGGNLHVADFFVAVDYGRKVV